MTEQSRYEVDQDGDVLILHYVYGYTRIECRSTGETIIKNITGTKWIPRQFDEVFGLGEYKKFEKHIVKRTSEPNPGNPHSRDATLVGDYLPKQAKKDMRAESGEKDLIGKYFK